MQQQVLTAFCKIEQGSLSEVRLQQLQEAAALVECVMGQPRKHGAALLTEFARCFDP